MGSSRYGLKPERLLKACYHPFIAPDKVCVVRDTWRRLYTARLQQECPQQHGYNRDYAYKEQDTKYGPENTSHVRHSSQLRLRSITLTRCISAAGHWTLYIQCIQYGDVMTRPIVTPPVTVPYSFYSRQVFFFFFSIVSFSCLPVYNLIWILQIQCT